VDWDIVVTGKDTTKSRAETLSAVKDLLNRCDHDATASVVHLPDNTERYYGTVQEVLERIEADLIKAA
jgi:hypothetical protein